MSSRVLVPTLRVLALPALLLGFAAASCRDYASQDVGRPIVRPATPVAPMTPLLRDTIFTATNEVRALDWDGHLLWAATAGGVLGFERGVWTKWDRMQGLPSHEVQDMWRDAQGLHLRFPSQEGVWTRGELQLRDAAPTPRRAPQVKWQGQIWKATLDGLQSGTRTMPLPPQSSGTHISVLIATPTGIVAALYGDGLWRWNGAWTRDDRSKKLPAGAREITALAGDSRVLWLGTRRDGVWRYENGTWTRARYDDEPRSTNVQISRCIRAYSTLQRSKTGW